MSSVILLHNLLLIPVRYLMVYVCSGISKLNETVTEICGLVTSSGPRFSFSPAPQSLSAGLTSTFTFSGGCIDQGTQKYLNFLMSLPAFSFLLTKLASPPNTSSKLPTSVAIRNFQHLFRARKKVPPSRNSK